MTPPTIRHAAAAGTPFVLAATRKGGAARFVVPRHFTAAFDRNFGSVELTVEVDESGLARVVGLALRGEAIDGGMLRQVPVAALLREALAEASASTPADLGRLESGGKSSASLELSTPARIEPRSRRRVTDELLERVAGIYRDAQANERAPTQAVADELVATRSAAAQWVAKARERGFLGPAMRGRAGEAN
jgi:hypothetical protein